VTPLRVLRRTADLSQQEFAAPIDVPLNTFRMWDSGLRTAPAHVLQRATGVLTFAVISFAKRPPRIRWENQMCGRNREMVTGSASTVLRQKWQGRTPPQTRAQHSTCVLPPERKQRLRQPVRRPAAILNATDGGDFAKRAEEHIADLLRRARGRSGAAGLKLDCFSVTVLAATRMTHFLGRISPYASPAQHRRWPYNSPHFLWL
jgi:hypothetical protein